MTKKTSRRIVRTAKKRGSVSRSKVSKAVKSVKGKGPKKKAMISMRTGRDRQADIEVTGNASTAAERQRRYRDRKRQGVICMARVPIYALDAEAFVKRGRLKPEDEGNREKIGEAVEALVDDFTEGKLVTAGGGRRRKS